MRLVLNASFILALTMSVVGCGDKQIPVQSITNEQSKPPLEERNIPILRAEVFDDWVEVWRRYERTLKITAVIDNVELKDLSINRGNCRYVWSYFFPLNLKYGQSAEFMVGDCDVLEITVVTDQGVVPFKWK